MMKRQPKKILLVDDHPDTADTVATALGMDGHEARAVTSGPDALRAAVESWPDVVVLDLLMPGMDGYAVAAALLAHADKPRPLMIAHTGTDRPEDLRKCREAGFDHCLGKPADLDELLEIVTRGCRQPPAQTGLAATGE